MIADVLDGATEDGAREMLARTNGSAGWVRRMLARRPFGSDEALFRIADEEWAKADQGEIREALAHHPRIGANLDELRKKYASTASWAAGEQAGAQRASEETLTALRDGNVAYEARYGFVFVVCATGKTADEMLAILRSRMDHTTERELRIAAEEQRKITQLRLEKLR